MAEATQHHAPGGHYSGQNKIPSINQFIARLDQDKKDRDKQIDEANKARLAARNGQTGGDAVPHKNEAPTPKENQKTVTDPTTGKSIIIEDVNKDMMERAKNPMVRVFSTNAIPSFVH